MKKVITSGRATCTVYYRLTPEKAQEVSDKINTALYTDAYKRVLAEMKSKQGA
jgi:hypothetical protein